MSLDVDPAAPADGGAPPLAVKSYPRPTPDRIRGLLVPSVADALFVACAVTIPTLFAVRLLNGDGDLPRHLRVGTSTLQYGLAHTDWYSFTRPGAPFVPFEWLSQVLLAVAYGWGGLPGVATLAALVLATTYASLVYFLRRRGVDPLLSLLVGGASALLGSMHWLARPHVFTLLAAACLLWLLEPDRPRVWVFLPFFAVWANLHGGFLYGFMLLGLYVVGDLAEWLSSNPRRPEWLGRARYHIIALAFAVAGSLLTPSGAGLLTHVLTQVGPSYVFDHTLEFQSPDFHSMLGKLFLAALLPTLAVIALGPRPSYPRLLVVLASVGFALLAQRNVPLFGIAALPLLALHLDPHWRQLRPRVLLRLREAVQFGERAAVGGTWPAIAAGALLALSLNHGRLLGVQLLPERFDASVFPVRAVERAREANLSGRMFNEFTWGGYIVQAWPEQRVFIDGLTAFYGDAVMREYGEITALAPGWREALERWRISMVIYRSRSRLVTELSQDPAWHTWYSDSLATILLRQNPSLH